MQDKITIADAPDCLNTNDKAMWVLGYEAAIEARGQCLHQIQEPAAAEQAAWHAGLDEGRAQAAPASLAVPMAEAWELSAADAEQQTKGAGQDYNQGVAEGLRICAKDLRAALAATPDNYDSLEQLNGNNDLPAAAPVVLPEPAYKLRVNGVFQDPIPAAHAFGLPDGEHSLFTEQQLRALLATATGFPVQADDPAAGFEMWWAEYMPEATQAQAFKAWTAPQAQTLQQRVQPWMMACFGPEISADSRERNHRFLEEALELVQSCGCTASEAHQLVDYVYGRPWGEPAQEAGGVMVTLAALCLANGLDMHACGETELARIWTKVEAIRAKQAAKPKHSPLPMQAPQTQDALRLAFVLSEIRRDGMDALSAALHDLDGFPLDHQASVEAIDRAAITRAAIDEAKGK